MTPTNHSAAPSSATRTRRWRVSSLVLLLSAWLVLQVGGLWTPGLLDDVDSIYLRIAREMLLRHDFVTPTVDGIRFFDKPPLMYWMAAASMRAFGVHDWAGRLPLALGVLALLLAVYALGVRFYAAISPSTKGDRGGLYAALALGTSLGPYLYTRFYIPDILLALWMTMSVHLFLIALQRTNHILTAHQPVKRGLFPSPLWPMLAFGAVMALNVLTKGLIGTVFPLLFVLLFLVFTRKSRNLRVFSMMRVLRVPEAAVAFLVVALPWHVLAALRNPAVAMPAGLGLPERAGWAWFYLYNEHIARFLSHRIPHDYGQTPVWLFWIFLLLWLLPWVAFLPAALIDAWKTLRAPAFTRAQFDSDALAGFAPAAPSEAVSHEAASFEAGAASLTVPDRRREAALSCVLWAAIVLGFFTLSARQEYYHLPALPALALLVGGLLAAADAATAEASAEASARRHGKGLSRFALRLRVRPRTQALRGTLFFLVPLGLLLFAVCGWLAVTAPTPAADATLTSLLTSNPDMYNVSLGHVFDLSLQAMGFFRGPLLTVALAMLVLGPGTWLVRRLRYTFAANLLLAASMTAVLLAAHEGLSRFYPTLGSKGLALAIDAQRQPPDLVAIDGELTSGSTLLFYTTSDAVSPVMLVNGRVNGPWFGSFWPDAPHIFWTDDDLRSAWSGPKRVFLLTYHPAERSSFLRLPAPVRVIAAEGGKTVLSNR